ncbi:P-loop containing nucleoside triphosphate hydrolase protein [Chytridium lagenaria]|nr:P-loop containing nucleoside triphosphate hydrolase protein [Chytridium lagenaria]
MLWYPPLRLEAVNVCKDLVERGIKFICFAKTRRLCEIVMKDLRSELAEGSMPRLANTVMAYRGGYMKEDRREIEGRMFQGKLIGIIATNALELGVDIGSIDVVIHVGFPYTFASYRQQSGRAGRREQESLSLLGCLRDQSFGANPSLLFDSTYETISLDIANPLTMEPHLQCASSEIGLTEDDAASYFSCDETNAVEVARKFLLWDPTYKVVIDVTTNKDIEDVEAERAPFTLYEGSVFVHQGRSYHVIDVNIERKYAKVRPAQVDYMTAGLPKEGIASYGTIKISTTCFGYFKMNPKTMKVIECVSGMESAPIIRTVEGIWMDVPNEAIMMLRDKSMDVEFAIHAASHAFLAQLPTCVRIPTTGATDIRTDCKSAYAQRPRPMR